MRELTSILDPVILSLAVALGIGLLIGRGLSNFCSGSEDVSDALPALLQFVAALQRIEQSPPVAGYESFLIKKGFEPIMARLLARNFLRLGATFAAWRANALGRPNFWITSFQNRNDLSSCLRHARCGAKAGASPRPCHPG